MKRTSFCTKSKFQIFLFISSPHIDWSKLSTNMLLAYKMHLSMVCCWIGGGGGGQPMGIRLSNTHVTRKLHILNAPSMHNLIQSQSWKVEDYGISTHTGFPVKRRSFCTKSKFQIFLFISSLHIDWPKLSTNMALAYKMHLSMVCRWTGGGGVH